MGDTRAFRRSASSLRGPAPRRDRTGRRVLVASLGASIVLHLALLVVDPPLPFPRADGPVTSDRLELLPAPKDQPPVVQVPEAAAPIPPPAEPVAAAPPEPPVEKAAPPPFIAHDVPPRLINPDDVRDYLQAFYPPELRLAGIDGKVMLWLYVDRRGDVTKLRVRDSSGTRAFDQLAQSAARLMRFRPALSGDRTVGVWVAQPLRFRIVQPGTSAELATR